MARADGAGGMATEEPWFAHGLRFACTRCGQCCRRPGPVRVVPQEIEALAELIGARPEAFARLYTRRLQEGELSLVERPGGECVFYEVGRGCSVYAARPRQCRTYPFWANIVPSEAAWKAEARSSPGIDRGALFDAEHVRRNAEDDGTVGGGATPTTPSTG